MNNTAYRFEHNNGVASSLGQRLRTVGQGLETLDVEDFELRTEGDGYFALAIPRVPAKTADADARVNQVGGNSVLQKAWHNLIGRNSTDNKLSAGSDVLRVLFTAEGLLRLEQEGNAKRSGDSPGVPHLKKLAPILRLVGECIDQKSGRLFAVNKRQDRISFEYVTELHDHVRAGWKLADLYEVWFDVSNRRHARYDVAVRAMTFEAEHAPSQP